MMEMAGMHILLLLDHTRKFMPAERLSWRHGCHIFFNDRSPKHVKSKLSPNVIWWQRVVQEQVTIIARTYEHEHEFIQPQ